jgi:hypothetical protein
MQRIQYRRYSGPEEMRLENCPLSANIFMIARRCRAPLEQIS